MNPASGEPRQALLARVRKALSDQSGHDVPTPPAVDAALVRTVPPDAPLVDTFISAANASGMQARTCGRGGVVDELVTLLRQIAAERATLAASDTDIREWLTTAVERAGVATIAFAAGSGFEPLFDADVGLSDVSCAIAETGTLVYVADAQHPRAVSIAPPVYVAVLHARQIVADVVDFHQNPPEAVKDATSVVYITGPSKTADIEGVLVTGVHGPGKVHVLVVDS